MKKFSIKKLSLSLLLLAFIGGGVFYFTYTAQGVNRTWDCGGGDSSWDNDLNWSGDTEPGVSDIAIFDATCTNNVTIDKNISVAGISIGAAYSGIITQSSTFTVTVGSSHYSQAAGTFTGGSATIDINGTFTLSGGTFTSTTGTLEVGRFNDSSETIFLFSSGTFNHNNGTVSFVQTEGCAGPIATIDVPTTLMLYSVNVNGNGGGCGTWMTYETGSGDTIIAVNNFALNDAILLGAWEVQGNVSIVGANGGAGTVTMTGTGNKNYTYTSGIGPHLRVNNVALSVSANTGTTDLSVQYFSLLAGTFTAPTGIFTIGQNLTVSDTFFTVSGGTFSHNTGTITFAPFHSCATQTFTVDVAVSLILYNVVLNSLDSCSQFGAVTTAAGDTIIVVNDLTLTSGIFYGTWEVQGDYIVGSGSDGGTATVTFAGGNDQVYTDQGGNEPDGDITINKSGGTVTLASNADWNAASQDLTITAGTLFAPDKNISTTALTIGASGALSMMGSQTLTLGGALANSGTVKIWGSGVCGGGDNALIRSSSNGVQRSWTGAGTFTIYDADVQDQGGSAAITAYSSTSTSGNGGNWTFSGAACPAQAPAASISSGVINVQSGSWQVR